MQTWKRIAWFTTVLASPVVLAQAPGGTASVQQALQEQRAEIELSKIAQNNSTNPAVINFAKATVRDETQKNRTLLELAQKKGLQVTEAPDEEHAAMVKILRSKAGSELDAYYAKDMARTEANLVQIYHSQSADSDRDIASYAQSALPEEEQHDKLAQSLADSTARRAT
jgi:putative membrane protein